MEDYSGVKRTKPLSLLQCSREQRRQVRRSLLLKLTLDYTEYMVDATFQKTDARAYLYGAVHEGFYNSLFPTLSRLGLLCSPYGVP